MARIWYTEKEREVRYTAFKRQTTWVFSFSSPPCMENVTLVQSLGRFTNHHGVGLNLESLP